MASPTIDSTHRSRPSTPAPGSSHIDNREPQGGVSDQRRAELEQLESDAGRSGDPDSTGRPHRGTPINPDIDTQ